MTSTDIAKAAGVSQSTVSMVLNKKYNVSFSKETVEKVEQAAKDLGYVPQKRKARKESKKEKLLVVFCSNLTNPYYVMLLQGIESRAKEQGFGLFVCNTQRDLRMEERYLKMMWELKPLGIIYTCNPSHCFMGLVEELSREIPVAIINNQNEKLNVDAVELDNSGTGTPQSGIYCPASYDKTEAEIQESGRFFERICGSRNQGSGNYQSGAGGARP